jgi:hypothetical protein
MIPLDTEEVRSITIFRSRFVSPAAGHFTGKVDGKKIEEGIPLCGWSYIGHVWMGVLVLV